VASLQLASGEHAVFEGHPSWRATLAFYVKGIFGAVVLVAAYAGIASLFADGTDTTTLAIVGVILLLLVLIAGYVWRMATTYTITNRRLHIKRGIVARRTQEARLERVQNVNTEQSVLQRLLRVGTVDFDTAGTDDHGFKFEGVADPLEVVQSVDRAQSELADQQAQQSATFSQPGTPVPRQQPPPSDPGL
jgi:uncharacterized membrane protein YdbT with pleckstrin-like domain